jgi:quinol monooxygenase YgiN
MKLTDGNGPKVAALLAQVEALNMPGNIKYNMAINGDTICGYEEWESQEAHKVSMKIPEVWALVEQAFPLMDGKPEMLFEGESI